jgi:hypothetical protein
MFMGMQRIQRSVSGQIMYQSRYMKLLDLKVAYFLDLKVQPTNLETRDGRHSSESSHRLEDH